MHPYSTATSWASLQSMAAGSVGGWFTMDERERLFHMLKALRPGQRMLEIGVFGGTTLSMAAMITSGVEIIGLDSWENETPCTSPLDGSTVSVKTLCRQNLEINGMSTRVLLVGGSSHDIGPHWIAICDALPRTTEAGAPLPALGGLCDFMIIDGDHTYEGARQDLDDFAPYVVPGGTLLMDDYINQVRAATDEWLTAHAQDWIVEHMYQDPEAGKMLTLRRAR